MRLLKPWSMDGSALASILILGTFVVLAGVGHLIAPHDPMDLVAPGTQPPSWQHWFGTTYFGEDVLSQVLAGARVSVAVGLGTAVLATAIGVNAGLVAGYQGGAVDSFIMRAVDFMYGLPLEVVVMVMVAVLRPSLLTIIVALSVILWRGPARVVRAQVLSLKEAGHVQAARSMGGSRRYVIYRHLAPSIVGVAAVYFAIVAGWAVVAEATISFLGFGDPEQLSWGRTMNIAFQSGGLTAGAWWWIVPPGLTITALVYALFRLGDWLDRIMSLRPVHDRTTV